MRIRILLVAMLCSLSVPVVPPVLEAADIHVSIQGIELNCPTLPATPCTTVFPLKKEYAAFKIDDKSATEPAQVRAEDNAPFAQDKLVLENAVFTSKQDAVTLTIAFWRTLSDSDLIPPAPPTLRFWRKANGSLTRGAGAAENDWVKVTGYVQNDEVDVNETKFVFCQALVCGNFNMEKYEDWFTLSGARDLKGWFKFNLKTTNDKMNVNWLHVESIVAGGMRDNELKSVVEGVGAKDEREDFLRKCANRRNGKSCPGGSGVRGKDGGQMK